MIRACNVCGGIKADPGEIYAGTPCCCSVNDYIRQAAFEEAARCCEQAYANGKLQCGMACAELIRFYAQTQAKEG